MSTDGIIVRKGFTENSRIDKRFQSADPCRNSTAEVTVRLRTEENFRRRKLYRYEGYPRLTVFESLR